MDRTRSNPATPLGISLNNNAVVLTSDSIDWDYEVGYMVTVGRHMKNQHRLEGTFMSIDHGAETATVLDPTSSLIVPFTSQAGAGSIFPDITQFPFDVGDLQQVSMSSTFHSAELNVIRDCALGDRMFLSGLAGMRWMYFNEDLSLWHGSSLLPALGNYHVDATNNLVGPQLGVSGGYVCGRLSIRGYAKGGLFANFADQRQSVVGITDATGGLVAFRDQSDSSLGLSSMVQCGLTGKIDLARHLSLRGGYHVIYLGGVATAADQVNLASSNLLQTQVENAGSVIYHGASGGIELRW